MAVKGGFRGQRGHAPKMPNIVLKQRNAGVHCNKNAINGFKLCLAFSHGLKFQVVYFKKMLHLLRDSVPRPPLDHSGWLPSQDQLIWPQLYRLDPPLIAVQRSCNEVRAAVSVTNCLVSCVADIWIMYIILHSK